MRLPRTQERVNNYILTMIVHPHNFCLRYRFKHCSNSSTLAAILHAAGYLGQEKALSSASLKEDRFIHTGILLRSCITPLFTCFLLSATPITKLVLSHFSALFHSARFHKIPSITKSAFKNVQQTLRWRTADSTAEGSESLRTTSALMDVCSPTWCSFQRNKTKYFKLQFTKKYAPR